jgi:hypothetical protein
MSVGILNKELVYLMLLIPMHVPDPVAGAAAANIYLWFVAHLHQPQEPGSVCVIVTSSVQ